MRWQSIFLVGLVVAAGGAAEAVSSTLEDGLAAMEAEQYERALELFTPLAEAGSGAVSHFTACPRNAGDSRLTVRPPGVLDLPLAPRCRVLPRTPPIADTC